MILVPYLHERKIHLNRQKPNTQYFYTSKQIELDGEVISYIFSFNMTESKLYNYTEQGILLKRINFSDVIKTYGDVACTSSNGLNFALFNRRLDNITIVRFNEKRVNILKTINVESSLHEFIAKSKDQEINNKA